MDGSWKEGPSPGLFLWTLHKQEMGPRTAEGALEIGILMASAEMGLGEFGGQTYSDARVAVSERWMGKPEGRNHGKERTDLRAVMRGIL